MQRFGFPGIVLTAIFAISAITSATAAAENPEILPVPTEKSPLRFTSEGLDKEYILETTKLTKIKCEKIKAKGEFTSSDLGTITFDFEKCESAGVLCKTEGDANGTLLVFGDVHLVDLKKAGLALKESLGIEILPLNAKKENLILMKCGVLGIVLKGSVLGREDKIKELVKTKTGELLFDQTKGEQEFTECELLKAFCAGKKFLLETDFGLGAELAGQLALKVDLTFEKEFEVHY